MYSSKFSKLLLHTHSLNHALTHYLSLTHNLTMTPVILLPSAKGNTFAFATPGSTADKNRAIRYEPRLNPF